MNEVLVTPAFAEYLLARLDRKQRELVQNRVDQWAQDMASGLWRLGPDAISIGPNGLDNGQHRLHGVVKSNTPIRVYIFVHEDAELYNTIDIGRVREFRDQIKDANASIISPATRYVYLYEVGRAPARGVGFNRDSKIPTRLELHAFLETRPQIAVSAAFVAARPKLAEFAQKPILCAAHAIFSAISKYDTDLFFEDLEKGAELKENDPVWRLRERLREARTAALKNGKKARVTVAESLGLIVTAWNWRREGKAMDRLRYTHKKGKFPTAI